MAENQPVDDLALSNMCTVSRKSVHNILGTRTSMTKWFLEWVVLLSLVGGRHWIDGLTPQYPS